MEPETTEQWPVVLDYRIPRRGSSDFSMLRVVGILLGLFLALIGLGFFLWGLLAMGFALRQSTLADSPLIIWEMSLTITGGAFVVILSVRLMWRAIRPPLIVPLRARHKSQPADR